MPKTILVPFDGSGFANRAIDYAGELASKYDAKVGLLHAIHYRFGRLPEELHQYAQSEHLDGREEVHAVVEKLLASAEVREAMFGHCPEEAGSEAERVGNAPEVMRFARGM